MKTTPESLAALDRLGRARSVKTLDGGNPGQALAHWAPSVEVSRVGCEALLIDHLGKLAIEA